MTPGTDDGLDEHERLPWGLDIFAAFVWAAAVALAVGAVGSAWCGLWVPAGAFALGAYVAVRVARFLA